MSILIHKDTRVITQGITGDVGEGIRAIGVGIGRVTKAAVGIEGQRTRAGGCNQGGSQRQIAVSIRVVGQDIARQDGILIAGNRIVGGNGGRVNHGCNIQRDSRQARVSTPIIDSIGKLVPARKAGVGSIGEGAVRIQAKGAIRGDVYHIGSEVGDRRIHIRIIG